VRSEKNARARRVDARTPSEITRRAFVFLLPALCHARRHWNSASYRTAAGNHRIAVDAAPGIIGTIRPTEPGRKPSRLILLEPEAGSLYGAEGARTPDLCNANAALSQLSYSPAVKNASGNPNPVRSITKAPIARGSPHAVKTNRRGRSKQAHCIYARKTRVRSLGNVPPSLRLVRLRDTIP
jgi:hypothetical protein